MNLTHWIQDQRYGFLKLGGVILFKWKPPTTDMKVMPHHASTKLTFSYLDPILRV